MIYGVIQLLLEYMEQGLTFGPGLFLVQWFFVQITSLKCNKQAMFPMLQALIQDGI